MLPFKLSKILDIMLLSAQSAGHLQMQYFRKSFEIEEKSSHKDLVTEIDLKSQKIILESLLSEIKKQGLDENDFGFIGEEEGLNTRKKYNFIIDPIDGTTNYAIGLEFFSVLIAFEIADEIVIGLIYKPFDKSYYYAIKDQGAYKIINQDKIKLEVQKVPIKKIVMSISHSSSAFLEEDFFDKIMCVRQIHGIGIEAAYLSENIFNIVFYVSKRGPKIWDIAAPKLILEESGGSFVDKKGNPLNLKFNNPSHKYKCIGGHAENINIVLKYLKNAEEL
jgi:myo-inositol-1(or 4)-monophosphatase